MITMKPGTAVMCRHDMSRDRKYTDTGQLMRMAGDGLIGTVESEHADEVHGTCFRVRFSKDQIKGWRAHSCAFYDREELMTHIHTPTDERIFVFGSNRLGIHGAGAARYAARDLSFPHGAGEGLDIKAYALPTCSAPGVPLTLDEVRGAVNNFIVVASLMEVISPAIRFFVSEIGCGFAGFTADEIAPLFAQAPANCDLPPGWRKEGSHAV